MSTLQQDTIHLHVMAPKSLLAEAMIIEARLSSTWYEVLREELNLHLTPEQGIFACSNTYTPSAPKVGRGNGWRADLSEQVREYVSKFARKRKQYTVRLCDPNVLRTWVKMDRSRTLSKLSRTAIPGSSRGGPRIVVPCPGESSPVVADYPSIRYSPIAHCSRTQQQYTMRFPEVHLSSPLDMEADLETGEYPVGSVQSSVLEEGQLEDGEYISSADEEEETRQHQQNGVWPYDNMEEDLEMAIDQEELRQAGEDVQGKILKSLVIMRMARYSEDYGVEVRNEILMLKRNGEWDMNKDRTPQACLFLEEIFKINGNGSANG